MRLEKTFIPYGAYWSTPFARWQGALASHHPLRLAAESGRRALAARGVDLRTCSSLVLGVTVPSRHAFYGAPWVAAMMGAPELTGPTLMQACATGARCIASAAAEIECGGGEAVLVVTADRTSNGPHLYYPDPSGPGGRGEAEDWVWDNFNCDPVPKNAMVETAENVAREAGLSREAQEAITLRRYEQYQDALKDRCAFQRRFMALPFELKDASGRKTLATLEGDEGVHPTTAEGLARLKPLLPEGTVTFGTQTHPADGNAGLIVASRDRARAMSKDAVTVRLASFAQANAKKGYMAQAVAPAAKKALADAGYSASEVSIKTHNPFALNDLLLGRELGVAPESFNNFGSTLVYGHPQAPAGTRLVLELIEELVLKGGGRGLFAGCAAGDTAAALCLEVSCR
ncbi:MAG: thiolase family protein [Myxococcales bacterium]|nr:thiolase family protein [Myxococcales bacterium]